MKVVAKSLGYYDLIRRRPGDTFILSDKKHLGSWMECLDKNDEASEKKASSNKSVAKVNGKGSKEGKSSAEKAKQEELDSSSDAEVI